MKILITGICGFVGSELARGLRQQASGTVQITGIDNLSRRGSWNNREALAKLDITVLHGDIRNASDLAAVGAVDYVIDAAATPTVMAGVDGRTSSQQLVENNLYGTVNLLELCKRHSAGLILLSTSRVYSIEPLAKLAVEVRDQAFVPVATALPAGLSPLGITEQYRTVAPVSLYGATKLASEQLALEYGQAFGFPVWVDRCSVMGGARQFARADQGIFAYWLHSWKENRPLRYIAFGGHGHQVRDCLHPLDLVPLLRQQMACVDSDKPPVINLSGGLAAAKSLAQLSDWCRQRWGDRSVVADHQPRPYDLPWVVLDHSLATTTWGWRPAIGLEQILSGIADFADAHDDWIGQSA